MHKSAYADAQYTLRYSKARVTMPVSKPKIVRSDLHGGRRSDFSKQILVRNMKKKKKRCFGVVFAAVVLMLTQGLSM